MNEHLLIFNSLWRTLNFGIQKMISWVSLLNWTHAYIEQYGRYIGVFNVSMFHCTAIPISIKFIQMSAIETKFGIFCKVTIL